MLAVAFQNCNKQNLSGSGGGPASFDQSSGGGPSKTPEPEVTTSGGGNYDGKVWAVVDANVTCPDGTHVVSQLRGLAAGVQLERLNCQPVNPPTVLGAGQYRVDKSGDFVTYQQSTFIAQPTTTTPRPSALALVCDVPAGDLPMSVLLYASPADKARVIAYADSAATTVRADSGLVDVRSTGTESGGSNADKTAAFDLTTAATDGLQKLYFVTGTNVSIPVGGTFNADRFDYVRSALVRCRAQ